MLVITLRFDFNRKQLDRWLRKVRETDGRIYSVECGDLSDFLKEWEDEVRGGESIWDRAVRYADEWEKISRW